MNVEPAWTSQQAPGHLGLLCKRREGGGEKRRKRRKKRMRMGRREEKEQGERESLEKACVRLEMRLADREAICLVCSRPWA